MQTDPRIDRVLELFDQFYECVYRYARRSVEASAAEDIAQEVFARLLRLPDLVEREIRAGYLFQIAKNLIRRRFESERRFQKHAPRLGQDRDTPDSAPERRESATLAARAIASRLDERERQALELVTCRGLSYRQAALSMGVKVSDVNNWRYRGVERLRREAERGAEGGAYGRAE
jgi:RNA polymerase sigma factor (sigma-70 family)